MRRALLLGNPGEGLRGVDADIATMSALLARYAFTDVVTLVGGDRAAVLAAIHDLVDRTCPGDAAVLYYSGHGWRLEVPGDRRRDGGLGEFQGISPADVAQTTASDFRGILADELTALIDELTEKTANVTVILDCCHATNIVRGGDDPRAGVRATPVPWKLPHAVMERHCDGLAALLATRHHPPRPARTRKLLRLLALGTGAVAVLILALRPWQSKSIGPWAATYYNRPDFTGQSVQRRDLDVNFEWNEKPPMDTIPADRYSVRWDSCLTLDKEQEVAFQLTSDDGSRLFIDGKQTIDNWGKHGLKARGRSIKLKPGVHHLRVEYFEHRNGASVALSASFGPDKPAPIPGSMLHAPPGSETDENPCNPA